MKITFDTNTLDKVARPSIFPSDPDLANYIRINTALTSGTLTGYFSETLITLEGIQKNDRASVLDSTQLRQEPGKETVSGDLTTIEIRSIVEQPQRKPLHPLHSARIAEAVASGMKILRAPRVGTLHITDPDGKYFAMETDDEREKRITTYQQVGKEIECRGVGVAIIKALAAQFALRDSVQEPWFRSLVRTMNANEENAVKRAVAEWADGDSIAAHIGYGGDVFCTNDMGHSAGSSSILDTANRAWLQATYGVRFATLSELVGML